MPLLSAPPPAGQKEWIYKDGTAMLLKELMRALATLVVASLFLWDCATIHHGRYQKIEITTLPAGAKVSIDGVETGGTPLQTNVKRNDDHIIHIECSGYKTSELKITNSFSGWVWGNIIWYPVFEPIGVLVDFVTGSIYSFTSDQIYTELEKENRWP